jgi:hypothetical protein
MPAVWPTIVGKERPREHWDTARLLDDRGFELDPTVHRRSARACPKPPVDLEELKSRAFDNDRGAHAPPDGRLPSRYPAMHGG